MIHGKLVVVEVGSDKGTVMAFDKKTGRPRWASHCREPAGHSSGAVLLKLNGRDCIANLTLFSLIVMGADAGGAGETVARLPWQTDYANNIPTPAVAGNRILVTSSYNRSRTSLVEITPGRARTLWTARHHAKVGSPVIYKDRVFLVHGSIQCLDLATGKLKWRGGSLGHGTCLVAAGDDKLIAFGKGRVVLLDAMAKDGAYRELSGLSGVLRGTCYPHVVLAGGVLCCKDRDGNLVCFSARPRAAEPAARGSEAPKSVVKSPPAR